MHREVKNRMESAAVLKVPLLVESGVGLNWDEAH
jgi:DNA polymerase-1